MTIQINRRDRLRILEKIVDRIASAGRDRQDARILVELESLHIDPRVFPNLVVNKRVEPDGEELLKYTLTRTETLSLNCCL